MKALGATAILLAGAALSLAFPASAQVGARSGGGVIVGVPAPSAAPAPGRNRWWGGGLAGDGAGYASNQGYFGQGAEGFEVSGGGARFEYDRGYPYDHYRGPRSERPSYRAERGEPSCDMVWTRDRSGGRVAVRVCRN